MKIIILVVFIVVLAALITALKTAPKKQRKHYSRKLVLTENEQIMYWRLVESLPTYVVLAQVSMSSVLSTKDQSSRMTISQKSLDFVICDRAMNVICAIEIDDKTHERKDRVKADKAKNDALEIAGIMMVRWKSNKLPSKQEITELIFKGGNNEERPISRQTHESKIVT